jgi:hypothetical protein
MDCWNPGDMDVFGRILRIWMPAIPAGMTKLPFLFSVDEHKLMNRSAEKGNDLFGVGLSAPHNFTRLYFL